MQMTNISLHKQFIHHKHTIKLHISATHSAVQCTIYTECASARERFNLHNWKAGGNFHVIILPKLMLVL